MAAIVLMLGSAMAAAVAGQVSVKKAELPPPPSPPEKKTNASFWTEEVERARDPEPVAVAAPAQAPSPVDCQGKWSEFGECSEECGGGIQTSTFTRTRGPEHGGKACPDPTTKTRECNIEPCTPVDCQGDWSEFGECSEECGGGIQTSTFTQTRAPEHGGKACPDPTTKTRECNTEACIPPLADENATFRGYRPFSVDVDGDNVRRIYRKCNSAQPLDKAYVREQGEKKVEFNDILSWKYQRLLGRAIEKCDKDPFCQVVELNHSKSIARTFKGEECKEISSDTSYDGGTRIWEKIDWVDPYIQDPVHGYEQTGSKNVSCSDNSGGWLREGWAREGDGEAPSFTKGGFKDIDPKYDGYVKQAAQICNNDDECKYVTVWLDGGYRTYSADQCEKQPMHGFMKAKTWKKVDPSVAGNSPIDCEGDWSPWSECSEPCNGGTQTRFYDITRESKYGGVCPGRGKTETQACNQQKCDPIDCKGTWSGWSACSKECDGGEQTRTFTTITPAKHGGTACPNPTTERRDCNTQACKPPTYPCGKDDPTINPKPQIRLNQLNDGRCDCKPGFDDEPNTGKCDRARKAAQINDKKYFKGPDYGYFQAQIPVTNAYGATYKDNMAMMVNEEKSGWESWFFSLGKYKSGQQDQWKTDCEQKAKDKGAAGFTVYRTQSDSLFWTDHKWYCLVYTKNNGKGTDETCTKAPHKFERCLEKPSFRPFEKDYEKDNAHRKGGLYWNYSEPWDWGQKYSYNLK